MTSTAMRIKRKSAEGISLPRSYLKINQQLERK
jgi:hypothetical protein